MSISNDVEAAAGETTTVIITSAGLCAGAVAERRPISCTWLSTRATGAASATALTVGAAGAVNGLAHRRRRRRGCARRRRGCGSRSARRSARRGCARRGRCTRVQVVAVAQMALNRAVGDLHGLLVRRARFMADGFLLLLS
jgi:hypothetical protein